MSTVVIVLQKLEDSKKIQKILMNHGYTGVFTCATAALAIQEIGNHSHGLVISGYRLSDMYYLDLKESLPQNFELLLIGPPNVVSEAGAGELSLTTPLKVFDLVNTVQMILGQIEWRIKKEKKKKVRTEQDEMYIRNAKYLLMERNHLTEEEAFRYIQKSSMNNSTNMVETAQMILTLLYEEA